MACRPVVASEWQARRTFVANSYFTAGTASVFPPSGYRICSLKKTPPLPARNRIYKMSAKPQTRPRACAYRGAHVLIISFPAGRVI